MEATGVCWKPGWHILSDVLANAGHVKNVRGARTWDSTSKSRHRQPKRNSVSF
jgi:hypothetical protein